MTGVALRLAQELGNARRDLGRLLEVDGVARVADDFDARRPTPFVGHAQGEGGELLVELADEELHRHLHLAEARPQRLLRPRAHEPQARRQPLGRVLPAVLDAGRLSRQRGEHRVGEPPHEERVDAVALDGGCELVVGQLALGPLPVVLDAGRRADEHEALDGSGMVHRDVQGEAAAHGVADVGGGAQLGQRRGAFEQVGTHVAGRAVAGLVGREHLVAVGGDALHELCRPRAARLGEPMDGDDAIGHRA